MTIQLESGLDIIASTRRNAAFRRELITGSHLQVVAMTIPLDDEIGEEVHPETDQLLVCVEGRGEARLDGEVRPIAVDDIVFVPAGARHNFVNRGDGPMRLVSVYAPPEHPAGTVHRTRAEAEAAEAAEAAEG